MPKDLIIRSSSAEFLIFSLHLKNIYNDLELDKELTTEDFSIVQKEGNREVKRNIKSERRFYQKITDIYATSIDYDRKSPITINSNDYGRLVNKN